MVVYSTCNRDVGGSSPFTSSTSSSSGSFGARGSFYSVDQVAVFSNTTADALQNTVFIPWMQDNAKQQ